MSDKQSNNDKISKPGKPSVEAGSVFDKADQAAATSVIEKVTVERTTPATEANDTDLEKDEGESVASVEAISVIGEGETHEATATIPEQQNNNVRRFNVTRTGFSCRASNIGLDVATEAKPIHVESRFEEFVLDADTEVKVNGSDMEVSFLGFGFKFEGSGSGIKTPFCNISW